MKTIKNSIHFHQIFKKIYIKKIVFLCYEVFQHEFQHIIDMLPPTKLLC